MAQTSDIQFRSRPQSAPVVDPVASSSSSGPKEAGSFRIGGMTCQNCARHVTEAIRGVSGVENAIVDLEHGVARVTYEAGVANASASKAIVTAVNAAGYSAAPMGAGTASASVPRQVLWLRDWRFNVYFGGAVSLILLACEWGFGLGMNRGYHWLAFALTLPVQVLCGWRFYAGAWRQLRARQANMDTLVALGSTTAFAFSTWALFSGFPGHLYFMESASIITLISVGHWLEARMSERAASSLRALLDLAPAVARRLTRDGRETEVPVAELAAGDSVVLKPGDRVPVDGEVVEGASALDESMLTGESLPVEKAAGAPLFAGTLNQDGRLVFRVGATGDATALAQIIAVVQRAQSSRAAIQRLGDQVSAVFVPIVVLIAIATGLWWGLGYESAKAVHAALGGWLWHSHPPDSALAAGFINACAVLIIACPCAMGLATPAAIMAGVNVAARRGILIRDGAALEKSGQITALVFDKTGTLTEGRPLVIASQDHREANHGEASLPELALALAAPSQHPLSRAVATWARKESSAAPDAVVVSDWREIRGSGVEARLDGTTLRLGSPDWLRSFGLEPAAETEAFIGSQTHGGATVLLLAADQRLIGSLAIRDELKEGAADVLAALQKAGRSVYLLTGDNRRTAGAIAALAGIPPVNVFAGVRPEEKAERVKQLQATGARVAFVGDGINDAPALEQADLGIAVSRASDVARESADVILLNSDLEAIPEALGLAQATVRTIKQNLFWAFFYNAAAIPLAALGFLSPILSAAAMGLSDVIVIGNALRLRRWRRKG